MSKNSGVSIFSESKTERATDVVRDTLAVVKGDDGIVYVAFTTNRGKGSGLQYIAIDEFPAVLTELRKIAEDGIPERGAVSAVDTIRQTITNEDGVLSFRTGSGKGAKPAKIDAGQMGAVVTMLEKAAKQIEAAAAEIE